MIADGSRKPRPLWEQDETVSSLFCSVLHYLLPAPPYLWPCRCTERATQSSAKRTALQGAPRRGCSTQPSPREIGSNGASSSHPPGISAAAKPIAGRLFTAALGAQSGSGLCKQRTGTGLGHSEAMRGSRTASSAAPRRDARCHPRAHSAPWRPAAVPLVRRIAPRLQGALRERRPLR